MQRSEVVNFNAGPAGLPTQALERARDELLNYADTGMSIMEHSHRGAAYDEVHTSALGLVRRLLSVPDSHEILFVQGGASACFATVPMNFLTEGRSADYIITGAWSEKALQEAQLVGKARDAGSGKEGSAFVRIPKGDALSLDANAAYLHVTSNNTIAGTQFHAFPNSGSVPLVADMSSDILSRPIDVSKFSMIYAGAQKNVGPSGVAVVIVEKGWAEQGSKTIPKIFRFKTHMDKGSLYNTPPTFSIYLMKQVLQLLEEEGGLSAVAKRNEEKAKTVYAAIDAVPDFYRSPVAVEDRSQMNVVFKLPTEELDKKFVSEAGARGMVGLKGHRSVGGCRASIYNAVSLEGAQRLGDFMSEFAKQNG